METQEPSMKNSFCAIGIELKEIELERRGAASLSLTSQRQLLIDGKQKGFEGLIILSTCNRTELYAFNVPAIELKKLLDRHIEFSSESLKNKIWIKEGESAIEHLLKVSGGLNSSILGDLQIISQVKKAWKLSQEHELAHPMLERWINTAIKTSKRIKSETELSDGSASISYASIKAIESWLNLPDNYINNPKILLIGVGDIGKTTSLNIKKYIPNAELFICNRSNEKAITFAESIGVKAIEWEEKVKVVNQADVVLTTTGAKEYVVKASMVNNQKFQTFLDLSVPENIDPAISSLELKTLHNIDHLESFTNNTLERRKASLSKAYEIVNKELSTFTVWLEKKQFSPMISWLKSELNGLKEAEIQRFKRRNPEADIQAAEEVTKHLIYSLTAKLAKFIDHHHQDISTELMSVQSRINPQT